MKKVIVCARGSPLSRKQVEEVENLLKRKREIYFELITTLTKGDIDQTTSLREMEKSDFFTRELDQLVLQKKAQVAIHSAKDLPLLPKGLSLFALTKGISSSDVLVLREGEVLKKGMVIGTSSKRREELVTSLMDGLTFQDIRGTIEKRLFSLEKGEIDGVVIAEAALIRLQIFPQNMIVLKGETTPLQGKLAVVGRDDDEEMRDLFSLIHYHE